MPTPSPSPRQAPPGLQELTGRELLDVAGARRRVRRLAEVDEMLVAAQWAVLHSEAQDDRDPMSQPGGDGTPGVREYCLAELAMAQETHALTARALIADTLDLIHRLPRTWALVVAGECEPWVARRVAVMSRPLLAGSVGVVDKAVSRAVARHAPSTVFSIARAKVIEADPTTHAAERERVRHERHVRLSRADEFGYRHVIARVTAGDAAWDRRDGRPGGRHPHAHARPRPQPRRAPLVGPGWLARPVDLLALLLEHTEPDADPAADPEGGEGLDDGQPAWAPDHMAATVQRLCHLPARTLASLRGRAQLFVHVTDEALRSRSGIARVEGVGPVSIAQLAELLGHADVTVQPVLDLRDRRRSDAYEHPAPTKDHVWTRTGGDVFPFSPRTATRAQVDFDHTTPYEPGGPPGQTGPHNSGPLRRRHHRWKTHGGYRCRTVGPGRHLWQTPHGLCFLVDHLGTYPLDAEQTELMLNAPPGVEIYLSPVHLAMARAA